MVNTKFYIGFTNELPYPANFDFLSEKLGLNPTTIKIFDLKISDPFKLNVNYWSAMIRETTDPIPDSDLIYVAEFLKSNQIFLKQYSTENYMSINLDVVIKMYDGNTPGINFDPDVLRVCGDLNIKIQFDMYIM